MSEKRDRTNALTGTGRVETVVDRWLDYYNNQIDRLVNELYAPDAVVEVNGGTLIVDSREMFELIERSVCQAAPGRYIDIDKVHQASDVVVIQAFLRDKDRPDWATGFCSILTLRGENVVHDSTYLNLEQWPKTDDLLQRLEEIAAARSTAP